MMVVEALGKISHNAKTSYLALAGTLVTGLIKVCYIEVLKHICIRVHAIPTYKPQFLHMPLFYLAQDILESNKTLTSLAIVAFLSVLNIHGQAILQPESKSGF